MPVKYTKEHEWIRIEGDIGVVGITDYAQQQLGDVVYVELPEVGKTVAKGAEAAVVESVKAASEIYAPASGEIVAVNQALVDNPGTVNSDPMGAWFFKIKLSNPGELGEAMDESGYARYVETLH